MSSRAAPRHLSLTFAGAGKDQGGRHRKSLRHVDELPEPDCHLLLVRHWSRRGGTSPAQHASTPSGARLADLACKQLLKAGDEGKLSSAEHVIFFLDFLCAINQPQRVLDAVQLPWVIAAFRRDEERLRFQGDALLKLQAYAAAQEVHERLLQVDADEWTFLQALLQCRCASEHLPLMQVPQ